MRFPIGAMSVGDILDRGMKLLITRLPTFYAINLIVLAPILVLQVVMPPLTTGQAAPATPRELGARLGILMLVFILAVILQPIAIAAILHVIAQEFVDQRVGVGDAFRFALRRFGSLLGASVLAGLVIFFGFLFVCLLCVPGFIFLVWYIFVGQVVVVENLGGAAALARSKDLTRGFRWRVFGVWLLLLIIRLILEASVAIVLRLLLPSYRFVMTPSGPRGILNQGYYITNLSIQSLVSILVATFGAVCWTLFYFDLRIRKEGYDLELAARHQAAAP